MTVFYRCDCCGAEAEVAEYSGEESDPITAPVGWRCINTEIVEVGTDGKDYRFSQYAHSCPSCNIHMDLAEHAEAEHEHRVNYMHQPGVDGAAADA